MKVSIDGWCVLDCNNHIVAMDSGYECARLVSKMNGKGYSNRPYTYQQVKATFEC